jgi:hypothetical protein
MPSEFNWPTSCETLSIEEVRLAAAGGVGGTGSRAILKYLRPELTDEGIASIEWG